MKAMSIASKALDGSNGNVTDGNRCRATSAVRRRQQLPTGQRPRPCARSRRSASRRRRGQCRRRRGQRPNTARSSSIVSSSTRTAASSARSNSSNIAPAPPAPRAHSAVVAGASTAERSRQAPAPARGGEGRRRGVASPAWMRCMPTLLARTLPRGGDHEHPPSTALLKHRQNRCHGRGARACCRPWGNHPMEIMRLSLVGWAHENPT